MQPWNLIPNDALAQLARQSLWFSRHECALLLAEDGGLPPYLKELAIDALQAEEQFKQQLATENPARLQFLLALKAWLARPDKTQDNFPVGGECWNDEPSSSEVIAANNTQTTRPTWQPSAWEMPVDSLLLHKMAIHPLSVFDEATFLRLLSGSFSLSVTEKKAVLDAIPTLEQFQIDELIKVFEDEQREFAKLIDTEEASIRGLDEKCKKEMALLHAMCRMEGTTTSLEPEADSITGNNSASSALPPPLVWQPRVWAVPVDSLLLRKMAIHPLSTFDEPTFLRLLSGSLSLSVAEKKRVLDAIPTLSQLQIDALTNVFEGEQHEFTQLIATEEASIRGLDEKRQKEMELLHTMCLMEDVASSLDDDAFLSDYLAIDIALLKFAFDEALALADALFDPRQFFCYEQQLKARKAAGQMTGPWLETLVQHAATSGVVGLADAVRMLIELEQSNDDDGDLLWQHLQSWHLAGALAWVPHYLRSRYHAFLASDEQAFARAQEQITLALALNETPEAATQGPLLFHLKRCLFLQGGEDTFGFMQTGLGPFGRYLSELGWLIGVHRNEFEDGHALDFVYEQMQNKHGWGGSPRQFEHANSSQSKIETHLTTLEQAMADMGCQCSEQPRLHAIARALADADLSLASHLLDKAWQQAGADRQAQCQLWHQQVALWRLNGALGEQIVQLQSRYSETPSTWHAWRLLIACHALGSAGRANSLRLAQTLAKQFWYLPAFQMQLFDTHHSLFVQSTHRLEAKHALWRAMAIGPVAGLFNSIGQYYRWKKNDTLATRIALLASLLANRQNSQDWGLAIICAYKAGKRDLGWHLFFLASHVAGYEGDICNCLAIGLFDSNLKSSADKILTILAINQALEQYPDLNEVLVANSSVYFGGLPQPIASRWQLYRAALAIWYRPQHVWHQYTGVLTAARLLGRTDLYIPAWYVGRAHGAEFHDSDSKPHALLAPLFSEGQMHMPASRDTAYLSFLAYALDQEAEWLVKEVHIMRPWHWIFALLQQVESLIAAGQALTDGFLAREAEQRRRELCLRPEWLLLRWPQQTHLQHQQQRAAALASLAQDFPDCNYQHHLQQDAADNQRRQLYRALSGGRIAHHHLTTAQRALPEWQAVVERYQLAHLASQSQQKQIASQIESHQHELVRQVQSDYQHLLSALAPEPQQKIVADWYLAIGKSQSKAELASKLVQIQANYFSGNAVATVADFATSERALSPAAVNFMNQIELAQALIEIDHRALQQTYAACANDAFAIVLKHHALANSEMFESFRTRIRHGWLIASLKDCFARFDLYNEGSEAILTPDLARALAALPDAHKQALEQLLGNLRDEFRHLVGQLDQAWLWLKDPQHPEGLLDFDLHHFDTLSPFANRALLSSTPDAVIMPICQQIDQRANQCFAVIQQFLRQRIHAPLNAHLDQIATWLEVSRASIRALPDGTQVFARFQGEINDARDEFAKRMDDYCAWFAFQEQGVRDFTLSEISHMAWQVVAQVDGMRLQAENFAAPKWHDNLPPVWLQGRNFSDLLEIFKILFQNIVYHARPEGMAHDEAIETDITLCQQADGSLHCQIASSVCQPQRIALAELGAMLADPAQWRSRMQGKQGSGLATVQEILQHRLQGMVGCLAGPQCVSGTDGKPRFVIEMQLQVKDAGSNPGSDLARYASPDVEAMLQTVAAYPVRVLIAEDQPPKFEALRAFILKRLPNCGVLHAEDLETTARLLSFTGDGQAARFDLVLLDMSLPEDPRPDSPIKAQAGLDVLKIMQIQALTVPTVMVTQYSNWADEATQNTRQFMENLSRACHRDFPGQFRAAVRFSHTDLAWQGELATALDSIFQTASDLHCNLDANSAAQRLGDNPNDVAALAWQARQGLRNGQCRQALEGLLRLVQIDADNPAWQADLACAYAGLGQEAQASQALARYQALGGSDASAVQSQMLQGQMQWLRVEQQHLRQDEMMATLGQIAGGMAHELFSPLAAIQTQVDFARGYLIKDAPKEAQLRDALDEIEQQKVRMAGIISHLRSLARGDKISQEPLDIGQTVRQALALQQAQMDAHGIAVTLTIPPKLPRVAANPLVMEQVFINLLLNARDALETVTKAGKAIQVSIKTFADKEQEWLQVRVLDNGPGVPESVRERLFEPFFTTKEVGRGLGLGLSLARKSVTEVGGSIYLESPAAGGACFVVELPIIEERST